MCEDGFAGQPPQTECDGEAFIKSSLPTKLSFDLLRKSFQPDKLNHCAIYFVTDIDECSSTPPSCTIPNSHCVNKLGGYECPCDTGYLMEDGECKGEIWWL